MHNTSYIYKLEEDIEQPRLKEGLEIAHINFYR